MSVEILVGDCVDVLRAMPDNSVDCIVTSPPYFGLRDYGNGVWSGGDPDCDHQRSQIRRGVNLAASKVSTRGGAKKIADVPGIAYQKACKKCGARRTGAGIGLEDTLQEHIAKLVDVFGECWLILKPTGSLWINYGDPYACAPGGNQGKNGRRANRSFSARIEVDKRSSAIKNKQLLGAAWRLAIALQDAGWILRQDIVWHKPNPMPESVKDRCTRSHEFIFHFTKMPRYFYNADAIAEPTSPNSHDRVARAEKNPDTGSIRANGGSRQSRPMKAVKRKRKTAESGSGVKNNGSFDAAMRFTPEMRNARSVWTVGSEPFSEAHFAVFPTEIPRRIVAASCPDGGVVLDPFGGAGTTAMVAHRMQRKAIMIEMNPAYAEIARRRIISDASLLTHGEIRLIHHQQSNAAAATARS